ncbi:YHS domain-containing (seleno)protein [Mangrovicoccus algicola]|uniref:YHS domain-containing protein n=1 Tax=Mangrovicoccus algicola TaxID=2771008 RepID=A0A8J6YXK4_9RHOB|nr:YHS domain-containing (seleno)protein [Mangrovicoccus algicola]MBE3639562.1 hypothetical protein [Mangrovicoccus algicola]
MRVALLSLPLILAAAALSAGPQYVDGSDHAVSGYDVVAYFDMAPVPKDAPPPAPVPGRADITARHNGAVFAFASAANRDRFLADPDRFAPQYDGHCAYGVAQGAKVPGDPRLWRIVEDRLYLNLTPRIARSWERDIPGNLSAAAGHWPGLDAAPASGDPVPRNLPAAPVAP